MRVAARHPQEVPRRLRQLKDVADIDDVAELEVELGGEAARQRLLLDDLGEADLVAAEVVVLVEEPRRQLVVDQRAARKEPGRWMVRVEMFLKFSSHARWHSVSQSKSHCSALLALQE